MDKLVTVEINGMEAFIIGVEDLVVDRLAAVTLTISQTDHTQAAFSLDGKSFNVLN